MQAVIPIDGRIQKASRMARPSEPLAGPKELHGLLFLLVSRLIWVRWQAWHGKA